MNDTLFQQALVLARSGQKAEARELLREVLQTDRANEMAWLWYSDCVETLEERIPGGVIGSLQGWLDPEQVSTPGIGPKDELLLEE
jgi:hypothetical protein